MQGATPRSSMSDRSSQSITSFERATRRTAMRTCLATCAILISATLLAVACAKSDEAPGFTPQGDASAPPLDGPAPPDFDAPATGDAPSLGTVDGGPNGNHYPTHPAPPPK